MPAYDLGRISLKTQMQEGEYTLWSGFYFKGLVI